MLRTGCNFARLKRPTLILRAGKIEEALYLVVPRNERAEQVLEWLRKHPGLDALFWGEECCEVLCCAKDFCLDVGSTRPQIPDIRMGLHRICRCAHRWSYCRAPTEVPIYRRS